MKTNLSIPELLRMAHSPIANYGIPGLTSRLLGAPSEHGTVRIFECSREHQECITPHSHRFDFQCLVLRGKVRNRVWRSARPSEAHAADSFMQSRLVYQGRCGEYKQEALEVGSFGFTDAEYRCGDCYSMTADEIHSIFFSRGAVVLFFEGPTVADHSVILEPYLDGEVVPTFKVEPWMFKREPVHKCKPAAPVVSPSEIAINAWKLRLCYFDDAGDLLMHREPEPPALSRKGQE